MSIQPLLSVKSRKQ